MDRTYDDSLPVFHGHPRVGIDFHQVLGVAHYFGVFSLYLVASSDIHFLPQHPSDGLARKPAEIP